MSELRECPFCGSKAEIYTNRLTGYFSVSCKATDANYHGTDGVIDDWCPMECETPKFKLKQDAIDCWNHRPTEDALHKRVGELLNRIQQANNELERICVEMFEEIGEPVAGFVEQIMTVQFDMTRNKNLTAPPETEASDE